MKIIYLIGGGGHCRSCIDVIEQSNEYKIGGIFDVAEKVNSTILGYKVIGTDDELMNYVKEENFFLITVGQIKTSKIRENIYEKLLKIKANIATVISTRAYVSPHSKVSQGTIVLHDALINAGAQVGENCIINSKSLIEHDAQISNHCHISTGAIVNGDCVVEEGCFIGSQSVLKEGILVKAKSIVSAGVFYNGKS